MSKLIKIPLLLLFIGLVLYELFQVPLAAWYDMLRYWYFMLPVLIGTFLNWGLESVKWKRSMQDVYPLTFKEAWQGVIWGNMFSFITPNRTGSFLGRILLLPRKYRVTGMLRSVVINTFQFSTTLILGALAFIFYTPGQNWIKQWALKDFEHYFYIGSIVILLMLVVLFLIRGRDLSRLKLQTIKYFRRAFNKELLKTSPELLIWSVLRYGVFVGQYLVLIYGMTQQSFHWDWIPAIALAFFLISIFPISIFSNIGVREQVFIWVFSPWMDGRIAIISLIIWILNVLLPVIWGIISYGRYQRK